MNRATVLGQLNIELQKLSIEQLTQARDIVQLLRGRRGSDWTEYFKKVCEEGLPAQPEEISTTIQVDVFASLTYFHRSDPAYVRSAEFKELQQAVRRTFDVSDICHFLHERQQQKKNVRGTVIFNEIAVREIRDHLGLAELQAIRRRGINLFSRYFKGMTVFALRSTVKDAKGELWAPCLLEGDNEVTLAWSCLRDYWPCTHVALRFESSEPNTISQIAA